ncbi:unnamed protein product [Dracunculus medinensis]|uniref:Alpha-1,3-mannosyl-glycoprotein 2-beta-N-acetylglucosaminyltransferase n=1 Tax=Dracunculus medinensis TaxID=318479 RepID=A0A0N4ULR5_DRAME|nr:unnamed protein product [Dracunculus medinensis]
MRKDFERIGGPAVYGLRRWKKDWLPLLSTIASDRAVWKRLTLAGVPRTAYFGVVTCFINHVRLFVAPNRTIWKGYDVSWEAPEPAFDILTL